MLCVCVCVRAVVLLASSHPVAFVQSKLSQDTKVAASIAEGEPSNPEPATPNPKLEHPSEDAYCDATVVAAAAAPPPSSVATVIQDFKVEPIDPAIAGTAEQVTFGAEPGQTINSDTLHALVEQLRPPPSPPQSSLEQIVIIRTVDNAEHNPTQQ